MRTRVRVRLGPRIMPILFRPKVSGSKSAGGRWRLVVDGVGGWGLDRHGIKYRLIDHNGEQICEGAFDECLDDAERIAKLGIETIYQTPDERDPQ